MGMYFLEKFSKVILIKLQMYIMYLHVIIPD